MLDGKLSDDLNCVLCYAVKGVGDNEGEMGGGRATKEAGGGGKKEL